MGLPGIHLIAPAGSCKPFFEAIGVQTARQLTAIVQQAVGPDYRVTGNESLIEAHEDELHGGRNDDQQRAEDLQSALADDSVICVVSLRGGAWFSRVLPLIDFSVLDRRTQPVAVFGFSELTTLVNIVGTFKQGLGIYDMGPVFLTYGLKRYASTGAGVDSAAERRPEDSRLAQLRSEFDAFFRDMIAIVDGRGTERSITGQLVRGELSDRNEATFVGGNLTVLSTLIGSPWSASVNPAGRWLVLEDFNDKVERIDRFLAHLTLARYWDRCEGILLGDFHKGYEYLTPAVLELLRYHIPPTRTIPVLVSRQIGHVWPMSPLPLHVGTTIERMNDGNFAIHWPASALRTA